MNCGHQCLSCVSRGAEGIVRLNRAAWRARRGDLDNATFRTESERALLPEFLPPTYLLWVVGETPLLSRSGHPLNARTFRSFIFVAYMLRSFLSGKPARPGG